MTTTQDEVVRLAKALKEHAQSSSLSLGPISDGWKRLAQDAFSTAEIELSPEEFERAWRRLWQSAFMGGGYLNDARRVLMAARGDQP
jgi:hypothetical protein